MSNTVEINFDGLVGPTHNYSGLSLGNVASIENALQIAHPRLAAIQGLNKMKMLMDLGVPQAVLPPHERPYLPFLRQIGYTGSDMNMLNQVYRQNPNLFRSIYSASSMWAANAATVSPSCDTVDHKVHITVANLVSNIHRFIEAEQTYKIFQKIFKDDHFFTLHKPLINQSIFSDEGAANYNRFCHQYGGKGLSVFVYGRNGFVSANKERKEILPKKYPARQTLEASQSIARLHQLANEALFLRQNPSAIDAGVFHNDVISVANQNVFLFHELAFVDEDYKVNTHWIKQEIQKNYKNTHLNTEDNTLHFIQVSNSEISLQEAVSCFLFNSQIVTIDNATINKSMVMIVPIECQTNLSAQKVIQRILSEDNPIKAVQYVDCRQSMLNGGGPACLRLRVVLTPEEKQACHASIFLNKTLYQKILNWINRHYRETISFKDLLDPLLLEETRVALDELTKILQLGSIYSFQ